MATTASLYFPYDAGTGANITESQWRSMTGLTTTTGVVKGYLNELAVTGDSTGMQVKLATGGCWIYGAYGENTTSVQTISLAASHATLNRYDLIVARNNYTTNVIEWDVIQGTNGASPTVPSATIDTTKYEVALAYVYVAALAATITAANVTDQRSYNNEYNLTSKTVQLTSASDTLSIDNIPARKFLRIAFNIIPSGQVSPLVRFNADSGANYAQSYSSNFAALATSASATGFNVMLSSTTAARATGVIFVVNTSAEVKVGIINATHNQGTSSAADVPIDWRSSIKWVNVASQITSVTLNNGGTGDYASGTSMTVTGSDSSF